MDRAFNLGLAATKLRPPTLPDELVQRARLDDVLDAGVAARIRLLLVSAPAGSGKSTLVASWLAGRTEPAAWLQAEEERRRPWPFLGVSRRIDQRDHAERASGSEASGARFDR